MKSLKILSLSDTHGSHSKIKLPNTDILIHSGDFTGSKLAEESEFFNFIDWYSIQNSKHKILVAGNHDGFIYNHNREARDYMQNKNIIYFEDSSETIEGIKFYGSPWSGEYNDWYFMLNKKRIAMAFDLIEKDTDILITHTPPYGYLDKAGNNKLGCPILAKKILTLPNLKYHFFGHIHESRGKMKRKGIEFINSSMISAFEQSYQEIII